MHICFSSWFIKVWVWQHPPSFKNRSGLLGLFAVLSRWPPSCPTCLKRIWCNSKSVCLICRLFHGPFQKWLIVTASFSVTNLPPGKCSGCCPLVRLWFPFIIWNKGPTVFCPRGQNTARTARTEGGLISLLTWLRNELGLRHERGGKHFSCWNTHQPAVSAVSL